MKTVTLQRYSVCPCGFPVMRSEIPLGKEYQIEPERKEIMMFRCGGCGELQLSMECVWVHPGGYMPSQIFEPDN